MGGFSSCRGLTVLQEIYGLEISFIGGACMDCLNVDVGDLYCSSQIILTSVCLGMLPWVRAMLLRQYGVDGDC